MRRITKSRRDANDYGNCNYFWSSVCYRWVASVRHSIELVVSCVELRFAAFIHWLGGIVLCGHFQAILNIPMVVSMLRTIQR